MNQNNHEKSKYRSWNEITRKVQHKNMAMKNKKKGEDLLK
jgi:hypothetical protein